MYTFCIATFPDAALVHAWCPLHPHCTFEQSDAVCLIHSLLFNRLFDLSHSNPLLFSTPIFVVAALLDMITTCLLSLLPRRRYTKLSSVIHKMSTFQLQELSDIFTPAPFFLLIIFGKPSLLCISALLPHLYKSILCSYLFFFFRSFV